jgi:SAM-dependent methyltransferase
MRNWYQRPEHWLEADWEAKAQENPLLAIMTRPEMADAPPSDFTPEQLADFFARGRVLYDTHLKPLLGELEPGCLVVEYGCGAGRIMKAVIDGGHPCAGVDISRTMLERCGELVPEAQALYPLDEDGRCAALSAEAGLVFSYSVLQHISTLSRYVTALDEICRMARPGGILAIQLNCEDFKAAADYQYRTENFETYSLHYRPRHAEPYKRHDQDHWSGVYIGYDLLGRLLAERAVTIERWCYHNPRKPRALWIIGRKG